ncbi:ABC-2 type transport system permease protein [Haloactinopolyspora alba]|uniref:ABC-2 type transport system permease protein n=1 Tax=Haloactinopolyspora alba TaxID=648780 RepID=A0A2P8DZ03_9ACTN|nr:ABC-2 family transporter protein [Haloactinopolyspora alba]PSL02446.1 ABC-2 type transport system permease protein [Haloactinopolyspora alba]
MGERTRAYRVLVGSRLRSQLAYRRSFAMDLLGSGAIGLLEFAEVYVIFANIDVLGELDFAAAALLFALANIGFSLADTVIGHVDQLPTYLRQGTLDAFLLRPLPVLAQLVTSDVSLRRLGRTALAGAILVVSLLMNDIDWTAAHVALLVIAVLSGTAIFAALFVCAAAVQFWLVEGAEFANAFTYGGAYAAQYPASIFSVPMRVLFTFVVPSAFTAYLPVLVLLDLEGPAGLPQWLGWCTPLAAVGIWAVALGGWRAGLRHYTGAGS